MQWPGTEELAFGATLFFFGFIGWSLTYTLFVNIYKFRLNVPEIDRRIISAGSVAVLHGLLTSICGIIILLNCYHDIMWSTHWLATQYIYISSGYLFYDTLVIYKHIRMKRIDVRDSMLSGFLKAFKHRPVMFLHHLIMIFVFSPFAVYRDGVGDFFVGCFYCLEMSTPFTNIRIILTKLGLKYSRTYTINGLCMICFFFVCRIVVFPVMYGAYGYQHDKNIFEVIQYIPIKCNIGCVIILLPQLYWITLMIIGARKLCIQEAKIPNKKTD